MKTIILVHPSMSPKTTFAIIKSKGYKIFSIITSFELTRINIDFVRNNSDYVFEGSTNVLNDFGEIDKIILTNKLTVSGVLNGIDSSIYYADFLAKHYIDKKIDLDFSQIRLNKNAVNVCLEKNNIPMIGGVEMVSINEINRIKKKLSNLRFPIIGKPTENTAAMSAVRTLYSMSDVDAYIQEFFNQKNSYYSDKIIDKVIFQEYIDQLTNKEFVLDFVTYEGKHHCRGIIHYDKEIMSGRFPISRFYRALSLIKNPELIILINYVKSCLDALNVRHGLTHNEVFYDGQSRVLLIEINNRVAGGGLVELMTAVYGSNPIEDYLNLIEQNTLTDIENRHCAVNLDVYNCFADNPKDINLSKLSSRAEVLHFRNKKKNVSDFFEKYSRSEHVNACVLLANHSSNILEHDCSILIEREKTGYLFENNREDSNITQKEHA